MTEPNESVENSFKGDPPSDPSHEEVTGWEEATKEHLEEIDKKKRG